jgi:isopenicillin N synthase-like dioxygenase
MASPVPVIDLAAAPGPDAPVSALELVRKATETVGVVQVVNHGVPLDLITEFDRRTGRLLGLPRSRKPELACPIGRYAQHHVRPADDPVLRDLAFRYLTAGQWLAERVLGLYARAQGLPEGTFPVDPLPYLSFTVNNHPAWKYPGPGYGEGRLPLEQAEGSVLTVLAQAGGHAGLEIQRPEGDWVPLPAVPGALPVFSGPLLTRWTNGLLRPARHRAVTGGTATRRATAVFRYPALGRVRGPLAPFAAPGEETGYEPTLRWDLAAGHAA